jgi:hypothetical protein
LSWGVEAPDFVPGCIVVLKRGDPPKGHVGFYVGTEGGHIRLLGGNQGDKVSIASFPPDRVLGRRVLDGAAVLAPRARGGEAVPTAPAAAGSRSHDVDILARTMWGEARGGSDLGLEAVAAVVLNRLRRNSPARFGGTIAEVCQKPRQFSCWNVGDPNRPKMERVDETDARFRACLAIAERAARGELADPTLGSDHYHTVTVSPEWSMGKAPVRRIDDHLFFNDIA